MSGSFGAGHDAAAREIARRFRERGHDVRVRDIAGLLPRGPGRLLRATATCLRQIRSAPGSWGWLLDTVAGSDRVVRGSCRGWPA